MKKITCYEECDVAFESNDRDALLGQMYDHYMKEHPDVIPKASDAEKKAWMEQFEKDWQAA